jgi:hypothetical protein
MQRMSENFDAIFEERERVIENECEMGILKM